MQTFSLTGTLLLLYVNNECVHHFLQNIEEMEWIDLFLAEIWPTFNQN